MANILTFGNKEWHKAIPNNTKVAIPLGMGMDELNELRTKLENAGMNFFGYISQEEDKSTVKISIPQKELDDFCRISGMENPVVESLNSNIAEEENKKKKVPVGNVNYRQLTPACRVNCDVETALLATSRMEQQNRPVSMKIWSFDGDKASISTDRNSYQELINLVKQIHQSRAERPKEAEKEERTPTPAPVVYSEMADEDVRKLAEVMMNNVCPSARNDLQKLSMYGEPPKIKSPFFDNKTVIDFRNGIDVSEKMGKELFEHQTGSFFREKGINIRSVEEDSFVITQNGKNYDISYSRLGVATAENLKEDFANDKRFQNDSCISEKEMEDLQLLYKAYSEHTGTFTFNISSDEKKHGVAIAERFLLVPENAEQISLESGLPFSNEEKQKLALALSLSHIGAREKFANYSLDVDYKKALPELVVDEIVKSAVEYKELILNSEAGKEFETEFENAVSGRNDELLNKMNKVWDSVTEYFDFYLKIAQQLQDSLQEQGLTIGKVSDAYAIAYALADSGEIELEEERIVEKPEPEKEQKQEAETVSSPVKTEETKENPEKTDVAEAEQNEQEKSEEAEKPKKTVSRRKKEEIKDFGRYIGGAKKENFIGTFSINSEWSDKERQENINKNNIWQFGKKEHLELRDKGVPVEVIYYINKIRNSIEPKPFSDKPEEQERYVNFVNSIKKACEDVIADQNRPFGTDDKDKMVLDKRDAILDITKNIVNEVEKMRKSEDLKGVGDYVTKKFANAVNRTRNLSQEVKNRNFLASPEQKLENEIDKRFTITDDETNRKYNNKTGFSVYDVKTHQFTDNFPTYDEARQFCKETIQNTKATDRKGSLRPPQLQHIVRTGEEYRREDDKITGEDIMERFRLYGGEFGNWESQQLRQGNLDMMYDSLKDLAKVMNIKATDIGLDGDLAIAFGSRGKGSALAHYEPDKHVINLTREKGAGSLAHEYGHALDRYISEVLNVGKTFASEGDEIDNPMAKVMETIRFKRDENQNLQRTDFYENACKLSGSYSKTGNGYWKDPTELFARAFACYVTDKLEEMGMKNTYLSGHSDFNTLVAPQGEERKAINQAIDNMLEEIKERGLLQEPITEKAEELYIYTRESYLIEESERSHISLRGSFTKTDECTLDGKDYLIMQSDFDNKLVLADKDGVVYDDNISVNYSKYDSLDTLVCDSICTKTAKTVSEETGISEKEAFSALKELYENGTYDFDDMHYYCQNVHDKKYGDEFDVEYVEEKVIENLQSAVKTVISEKEQEIEEVESEAPDLD